MNLDLSSRVFIMIVRLDNFAETFSNDTIMKSSFLVFCFLAVSQLASAQLSAKDFMSSTTPGQAIESTAYSTLSDTPSCQCWAGAYSNHPIYAAHSPIAGEQLFWAGYGEKGNSIVIGSSFPERVSGPRPTTFAFQRKIKTGVVYLSCIILPKSVINRKYWMHIGFSHFIRGNGTNCCAAFFPEGRDGKNYNIALRLSNALMILEDSFECNKKHLIVLKYDFTHHALSIFVDPNLTKPEPVPDEVVTCRPSPNEDGIAGIIFRDVSGNKGNIGSFRVSRAWEDIR